MNPDYIIEVFQRLSRIETKLDSIGEDLKVGSAKFANHDKRIRRLEALAAPVIAGAAFLGALAREKLREWTGL